MAIIRIHAKVRRIESFISSLRNAAVKPRLASLGLNDEVLAHGEDLVRTARHMVFDTPINFVKTDLIDRVGAWEKRWVPVIGASLRFEHPVVHERLFRGIERGQGEGALVHVLTLAERLLELAASTQAGDQAAFALLGLRGVTEAGVQTIADLIRNGERFTATGPAREERDKALADAWSFYLVWSEIARTAIKEKALLRRMGFRRNSAASTEEAPADAAAVAPEGAAAAPSTSPAAPAAADGSEVAHH